MRPDVSLQQPGSGEGFAADLAYTGQRVRPDVHLQGPQTHVLLFTVFAAEGLPGLRVAVQLLVLEQPGVRGVRLAAQRALKLLGFGGVRLGQLRVQPLIFVAARALGAALGFGGRVGQRRGAQAAEGRRVCGDRRQITRQRGQGQAAGSPYRDGIVRYRAQDLWLGDGGCRERLVQIWRNKH